MMETIFKLKHRIDGGGRYKLSWNWVEKKGEPGQYHYNYWATFDSVDDAQAHYDNYVKGGWPNVKWEIADLLLGSELPTVLREGHPSPE
jgi:hypothetical protein